MKTATEYLADTGRELMRRAGMTEKPPNTSIMLIRADGPNVFKVMCFECNEGKGFLTFDVFGTMAPAGADGECTVIQRCLEHLGQCQLKTKPVATRVIQNTNTGEFKLSVEWMP